MMNQLNTMGESKQLAEIHALSSGLKACSTWDCLAGIEECRKACGGHGYSAYAGIGHIWANGVASQTYEGISSNLEILTVGDNYVISQQTAKACLKYMAKPANLPPSAEYLSQSHSSVQISSAADWMKSSVQLSILESRARQAVMKLGRLVRQGTAWKDLNMDCVTASRAHVEVFLLRTFINTISTTPDSSLQAPLTKLQNLVYHSPSLTNRSLPSTFSQKPPRNF